MLCLPLGMPMKQILLGLGLSLLWLVIGMQPLQQQKNFSADWGTKALEASTMLEPKHPFHTSITEAEYNSKSGKVELTIKVFIDDLELAIGNLKGQKFRLKAENSASVEPEVLEYISTQLKFISKGSVFKPEKLIGKEVNSDAVFFYVETEKIPSSAKPLNVVYTLLTKEFEDQMNVFHFSENSQKKSLLLSKHKTSGELRP